MCAGGNYTFDPKYSWDDANCETNAVFICELMREWLRVLMASRASWLPPN